MFHCLIKHQKQQKGRNSIQLKYIISELIFRFHNLKMVSCSIVNGSQIEHQDNPKSSEYTRKWKCFLWRHRIRMKSIALALFIINHYLYCVSFDRNLRTRQFLISLFHLIWIFAEIVQKIQSFCVRIWWAQRSFHILLRLRWFFGAIENETQWNDKIRWIMNAQARGRWFRVTFSNFRFIRP